MGVVSAKIQFNAFRTPTKVSQFFYVYSKFYRFGQVVGP